MLGQFCLFMGLGLDPYNLLFESDLKEWVRYVGIWELFYPPRDGRKVLFCELLLDSICRDKVTEKFAGHFNPSETSHLCTGTPWILMVLRGYLAAHVLGTGRSDIRTSSDLLHEMFVDVSSVREHFYLIKIITVLVFPLAAASY
jgi:hypothetical protein